jgi:hypothetical protein
MVLTGVRGEGPSGYQPDRKGREREREGVGELTGTAKGGRGGLIHRDVARLVCSASAVVFLTV